MSVQLQCNTTWLARFGTKHEKLRPGSANTGPCTKQATLRVYVHHSYVHHTYIYTLSVSCTLHICTFHSCVHQACVESSKGTKDYVTPPTLLAPNNTLLRYQKFSPLLRSFTIVCLYTWGYYDLRLCCSPTFFWTILNYITLQMYFTFQPATRVAWNDS